MTVQRHAIDGRVDHFRGSRHGGTRIADLNASPSKGHAHAGRAEVDGRCHRSRGLVHDAAVELDDDAIEKVVAKAGAITTGWVGDGAGIDVQAKVADEVAAVARNESRGDVACRGITAPSEGVDASGQGDRSQRVASGYGRTDHCLCRGVTDDNLKVLSPTAGVRRGVAEDEVERGERLARLHGTDVQTVDLLGRAIAHGAVHGRCSRESPIGRTVTDGSHRDIGGRTNRDSDVLQGGVRGRLRDVIEVHGASDHASLRRQAEV